MISFIVPAHNEEFELSSTLAAIRAGTSDAGRPYEIIVVDDASTDATPEIAAQAGAKVDPNQSTPNRGRSECRRARRAG